MANYAPTDLRSRLEQLLGPEGRALLEQVGIRHPTRFRFNPLKHNVAFQKQVLSAEGFEVRPLLEGLGIFETVNTRLPLGKSLSHFMGHIYIQDLASMLPPMVLDPQPADCILDLCAAPGSKATQLAAMMRNQGLIVANDVSRARIRSLVFNLRRMGVLNVIVTKGLGEQFGNQYFEFFDRVLLDAPCSAIGTLHKSPEVLSWWTPRRTERLAAQQQTLLLGALKALKPGGLLVYATCTVTPEENESVIDNALRNLPVEAETIGPLPVKTRPGLSRLDGRPLSAGIEKTVRVYPQDNQCEAFFLAKLRKTASFGSARYPLSRVSVEVLLEGSDPTVKPILSDLAESFGYERELLVQWAYAVASELFCVSPAAQGFPFYKKPVRVGLPVAHLRHQDPKLTTEGSHLLSGHATRRKVELSQTEDLFRFANRETIETQMKRSHQVLVNYRGNTIGHGLVEGNRLLSRFPRSGWMFGSTLK